MERKWRVTKENIVNARCNIAKGITGSFTSPNPKDFCKYFEMMMDEIKFRKLFDRPSVHLKQYEEMMESD